MARRGRVCAPAAPAAVARLHLLAALVVALPAAGTARGGAPKTALEDEWSQPTVETKPFDPRDAIAKVAAYQASHPEFAAGIITWLTLGLLLFTIGTALFVYSEIRAMLVVRDQDFRRRLLAQGYFEPCANIERLGEEENINMAVRPYVSLVGMLLIFVAFATILYPLCDVITVLGLPATPCILIITFGSFFAAVCMATLWLFLIWMCTRPAAALVFLAISLSGQILIPSGNPILLLLWIVAAAGGSWLYFFWLPDAYEGHGTWLQDVGSFKVSYQPAEIMAAFEQKISLEASRFQPEASTLGAKAA